MKRLCLLVLFIMISNLGVADVIVFKDGRQVKAPGVWIEDGRVKWVVNGKIYRSSLDQVDILAHEHETDDASIPMPSDRRNALLATSSGKQTLSNNSLEQFSLPDDNQPLSIPTEKGRTAEPEAAPPAPDIPSVNPAELNRQAVELIDSGQPGDIRKALSLLEQAIAADPGYADSYYNRARIFMDREAYEKAAADFRRALGLDANKPKADYRRLATAYYDLGTALQKMNNPETSAENYHQALSIRQERPEVDYPPEETLHNRLGLVYSAMGNYSRSIEHYQRALEIIHEKSDGDTLETAVIYNNLGAVSFKNRDYDNAVRFFQQALNIRQAALGDDHSAVEQVKKYLDMARRQQQSTR